MNHAFDPMGFTLFALGVSIAAGLAGAALVALISRRRRRQ